ncbi:MAG: type II toxin-antitoxin system RelE/ParE family toxin [Kineosporiaceae bacterium]|nr:type II toxin-antitoxin system RelE/ParE family toxin [Kineosporiaceae bacterium]
MTYALRLSPSARRSLERDLPEAVAAAVWEFVSGDLLANPHRVGKALRFDLAGYFSARRGMYRVIYRILDEEVIVEVIKISHRADAYI